MAQTGTGTGGFTNAIQIFYIRRLLTRLEKKLKLDQFALKTKLPTNEGNEVKWRRYTNFAANVTPLTEGTSPTPQTLQSVAITAVPVQFGATVEVTDFLIDEAIDPVITSAVDVLAYQGALSFDTLIRNGIEGNLTEQFASTAANEGEITAAMVFNAAELREAVTTLKAADVMAFGNGDYAACIHPNAAFDFLSDDDANGWVEVNKYTNLKDIMKGELGRLYQAKIVESSNINVTATGAASANVYHNFVFGMESFGIVELAGHNMQLFRKQLGSAGTADPLNQRATVGYKFSHALAILDAARGIEVLSGSSL